MENFTSRFNRIAGQIKGIQEMIEADRDCLEIAVQFQAARSALDSSYAEFLKKNIEKCLKRKNSKQELAKIIQYFSKL